MIMTEPWTTLLAALWAVARLLVLAYMVVLLFVYLTQSRLIYYPQVPERGLHGTPADLDLDFTEVTVTTADGVRLHGWFIPHEPARGTVLFFHGNAGNIGHRLGTLELLHQMGLNVMLFDYRGYGRSGGRPSEQGTYRDAEAVWGYLTADRGLAPDSIVLFGRSLGGAVAAWLAARVPAGALVLDSTFTSVPDLAAEVYPFLPARWLSRFRYDSKQQLADITEPVLVIHGEDDAVIPFHHGRALFAAAPEPKEFLTLRGGHNSAHAFDRETFRGGLEGFLSRHL
ncbi:MAG TPA: alpha/beta hydrolase [Gammaproteobacteria bacterium]|nr:alpha/beta hydrolase [Gammaproteobacteria bacterium]